MISSLIVALRKTVFQIWPHSICICWFDKRWHSKYIFIYWV